MKRNSLGQWCKDAGPIGPACWLFEGLVEFLTDVTKRPSPNIDHYNENDEALGIFLLLLIFVPLATVLALTFFFSHLEAA